MFLEDPDKVLEEFSPEKFGLIIGVKVAGAAKDTCELYPCPPMSLFGHQTTWEI